MPRRSKRKRNNEFEVEVRLDVPSHMGRSIRLVVLPTDKIEEVKAKIHWYWHIPFDEKGDMWLLGPDDHRKNLREGFLLLEYDVVQDSRLVYTAC